MLGQKIDWNVFFFNCKWAFFNQASLVLIKIKNSLLLNYQFSAYQITSSKNVNADNETSFCQLSVKSYLKLITKPPNNSGINQINKPRNPNVALVSKNCQSRIFD